MKDIRQDIDDAIKKGFKEKRVDIKEKSIDNLTDNKIKNILGSTITVQDMQEGDTLGSALIKVIDFIGDENNRLLLGNSLKENVWEISIINGIIRDLSYNIDYEKLNDEYMNVDINPEIIRLTVFLEVFMLTYNTGRGAIKGQMRETVKDIFSSIMSFKSNIEYREAGIRTNENTMFDNIKERFKK